jgi:hypothetical protein
MSNLTPRTEYSTKEFYDPISNTTNIVTETTTEFDTGHYNKSTNPE